MDRENIIKSSKIVAQEAMDFAMKNGCDACRINISGGESTDLEVRDDTLDSLQLSTGLSMNISLYVNGRFSSISTNRLKKDEVQPFILNGIEATRMLEPDPFRVLEPSESYYQGDLPDLQMTDDGFDAISIDDKIAATRQVLGEITGKDKRIITQSGYYEDMYTYNFYLISNGFEGFVSSTSFALGATVSLLDKSNRPEGFWSESRLLNEELLAQGIGEKTLNEALGKIGQKKIKKGFYTTVVSRNVASQLLSPLINAMKGTALQQQRSFLIDKKGQAIMPEKYSLIDNPHIIHAPASLYFNQLGVKTQPRTMIGNGVLEQYYIGHYMSKKLNVEATSGTPSNVLLTLGDKDESKIISSMSTGVFITNFNGGNSNPTTGDFSYGIEGFLIETGQLTTPIAGMIVTGNMLELWRSLVETGNDPRPNMPWQLPTLVFDKLMFN